MSVPPGSQPWATAPLRAALSGRIRGHRVSFTREDPGFTLDRV